jgi:shikimate kinase
MSKKILIMGLPGAGKSYLANILAPMLSAIWLNADKVRKQANDWDFSEEGRARQAKRMKDLSNEYLNQGKKVIADFVCPTEKLRKEYNPDFTIFMDTIKKSRYENTNKIFEQPKKYNFHITKKNAELYALQIADLIQPYKFNNKKPTAQMLGRFQPWHLGHQTLFEEILKKTGQVHIMIRDVYTIGDNPFKFKLIKKLILKALQIYKNRIKISLVPNITNICYGRGVGYKIEEIVLPKHIQKISATKIRKKLFSKK